MTGGGVSRGAVAGFLAVLLGAMIVDMILTVVAALPTTPVIGGPIGFLGFLFIAIYFIGPLVLTLIGGAIEGALKGKK